MSFDQILLNRADFSGATGDVINVFENQIKGTIFYRFEAISLLEGLDIRLVD